MAPDYQEASRYFVHLVGEGYDEHGAIELVTQMFGKSTSDAVWSEAQSNVPAHVRRAPLSAGMPRDVAFSTVECRETAGIHLAQAAADIEEALEAALVREDVSATVALIDEATDQWHKAAANRELSRDALEDFKGFSRQIVHSLLPSQFGGGTSPSTPQRLAAAAEDLSRLRVKAQEEYLIAITSCVFEKMEPK